MANGEAVECEAQLKCLFVIVALIISSGASEVCGILQFTVTHLSHTHTQSHQNKAGTAGCMRGACLTVPCVVKLGFSCLVLL